MFQLTETELAAGITLSHVEHWAARALTIEGQRIVVDHVGPALAGAVARYVGRNVWPGYTGEWAYLGLGAAGFPVYGKAV